jgi:2-isopropylmalate synthase
VQKNPTTYEHIDPALVGNAQRVLVSDLSGRSNILYKAAKFGIDLESEQARVARAAPGAEGPRGAGLRVRGRRRVVRAPHAEGARRRPRPAFRLIGFRVIDEKRTEDEPPIAEATIMLEGPDGRIEHTAAQGNGP